MLFSLCIQFLCSHVQSSVQSTHKNNRFSGSLRVLAVFKFIAWFTSEFWGIVTIKPPHRLLIDSISLLKKPSLIEHSRLEGTRPWIPSAIFSLPCNPHAVWFKPLCELGLFKPIIPQRFHFPLRKKPFFCSRLHVYIRYGLASQSSITAYWRDDFHHSRTVYLPLWTIMALHIQRNITGGKASKVTSGACICQKKDLLLLQYWNLFYEFSHLSNYIEFV